MKSTLAKKPRSNISAAKTASNGKAARIERPYPRNTLHDAIGVPLAIRDKNGGNPWAPSEIAATVGRSAKTSGFFYLTTASRDFGLTTGTRDTAEIALTDLGRRLAYAETADDERKTRLEAFLNVELFKQVLEYYKGSSLPEMKYLRNTLENKFKLDPGVHEEFAELFRKNCEYLAIKEGVDETVSTSSTNGSSFSVTISVVSSDLVTVAEPDTDTGLVCFVAMPFSERSDAHANGFFAEVLKQIIAPAGRLAGFKVVTARKKGSDVIHATIVNGLLDADLVVADLTEHNPNVLFELGMRMAEDKSVALVRAEGTKAIFDVDNMLRVEEYSPCLWPSTVEKDVPKILEHLKATWEHRENNQSYLRILRAKREHE